MNYSIIHDLTELEKFVGWLPELGPDEQFYLCLFARKKYSGELIKSNDRAQLKRFTSTKERIIDKLRQLSLPLGAWKIKDVGVPQESLVAYIHPNPRDMWKANQLMGKKCWDLKRGTGFNLHQEAMSCIQKAKSRSWVVTFDVDHSDFKETDIQQIIDPGSYIIIKTRGGSHVLVKPQQTNPRWHPQLTELLKPDQVGDLLSPIPGTIQGGFLPYVSSWGSKLT